MADTFSKEKRSQVMKLVKSSGNKSTELKLITYFRKWGIKGWRRNYKLIGRPDFVFPSRRATIFLDGCFWHGHNCRNTKPKNNERYWQAKISKNAARDTLVTKQLQEKDWYVLRIWECELKKEIFQDKILPELMELIRP